MFAVRRWLQRLPSEYSQLTDEEDDDSSIFHAEKSLRKLRVTPWKIPGLVFDDVTPDSFLPSIQENSESLDEMICMLDRLDGTTFRTKTSKIEEGFAKIDPSKSFETAETGSVSEEESFERAKSIQWADRAGKELDATFFIPYENEAMVRIIVMLLSPENRKFEFLHCEFFTEKRVSVADVLKQLPKFATNEVLSKERFGTLCVNHTECINMLSLQEYNLIDGDILVAIPSTCDLKASKAEAAALLENKLLRKALRKARLSGRALQRLLSSQELEEQRESELLESNDLRATTSSTQCAMSASIEEDLLKTLHPDFSLLQSVCYDSTRFMPSEINDSDDVSFLSLQSIEDDDFVSAHHVRKHSEENVTINPDLTETDFSESTADITWEESVLETSPAQGNTLLD